MFKAGEKVALVAMSDPVKKKDGERINQLVQKLEHIGLRPVLGEGIFERPTGKERAKVLMEFYLDEEVGTIFDISGGDIANGVLPHIDYEEISRSNKVFWGYSDLTTLVNAIYAKSGKPSVLYQIRNLISEEHGMQQTADFQNSDELFRFGYKLVQGNELHGTVVGGNIRCFLKLAGTPYMPDLTGKVLLLEARSGFEMQIETYMAQLSQMGVFDKVSGILLGTFTKLESMKGMPRQEEILKKYVREDLPVAVTRNIGHGTDSKAIWIGKEL